MNALLRRLFDGLGTRIALVLAVALLPLAIVSTIRSQTIISQSQSRSEAALEGETLRAISPEVSLIDEARGTAYGLAATIRPLLDDPAACSAFMRHIVDTSYYSFAGYIDLSGRSECSSADTPFNLEMNEVRRAEFSQPLPVLGVNESGQISRVSVLYTRHPVLDDEGTLTGFVTVSVPHSELAVLADPSPFPIFQDRVPDVAFFTLNATGDILTYSRSSEDDLAAGEQLLPQGIDRLALLGRSRPFAAVSQAGVERTYSVIPLFGGQLFALGTWPLEDVMESALIYRMSWLFPALMWTASLVTALFAAEFLVTRHVRGLRTAISQFVVNRRGIEVGNFARAPSELRDMAQSHALMTDTILREEAELEDSVRQKDVLLREVHHRVKNNLQLIASIMNMQMRKSRSDEARSLMRGLHDRVMSLATVHKGLYQTSGLADVHADELLADILHQITHLGSLGEGAIEVEQSFDPLRLSPEQAVPLTLLVTEALTNAVKYAGAPAGQKPRLRIRLIAGEDRQVTITVANTLVPEAERGPNGPAGLGSQLLAAFAQQLHGRLEKEMADDWFIVTVSFEADQLGVDPNGA